MPFDFTSHESFGMRYLFQTRLTKHVLIPGVLPRTLPKNTTLYEIHLLSGFENDANILFLLRTGFTTLSFVFSGFMDP